MATILIAGCGYLGTALGLRLIDAGHEVAGLRRRIDRLPPQFRGIAADVGDPGGLRRESLHADYLVYTAGASGFDESAYRAAYVDGLRHAVDAVQAQNPRLRRILFTSSTSVYGQHDGEWVDETSPAEASHFSGRMLLEGEAYLAACGVPAVVLRLGGIYGPGRSRLIDTVREGRATITPGPPRYLNLNHRDDCAGALAHLLAAERPEFLYLGADGQPEDRAVILRWIAARLGVPEPPVSERALARPGRSGNKRCCNDRLLATGYRFEFPDYRAGYGALIDGAGL